MAISPLTAWGVLTINGHEVGKAFSSLNAKVQSQLGGPDPLHAHLFVRFLADLLARILHKAVGGIIRRSEISAMGMLENLDIPVPYGIWVGQSSGIRRLFKLCGLNISTCNEGMPLG